MPISALGQSLTTQDVNDLIAHKLVAFGVNPQDLIEYEIVDQYVSSNSGVFNLYLRQKYQDIPVYNGIINIHLKDEVIVKVGDRLVKGIRNIPFQKSRIVSAEHALRSALAHLDLATVQIPRKSESRKNKTNVVAEVRFQAGNVSKQPISTQLFWIPKGDKGAQLIWVMEIDMIDGADFWHICIDAEDGKFVQKTSLNISCQFGMPGSEEVSELKCNDACRAHEPPPHTIGDSTYNVFDLPNESPNHGVRKIVHKPWERAGFGNAATTYGWHYDGTDSFLITRGNNVFAYEDTANTSNGYSPMDSSLSFDYTLNFGLPPDENLDASITNLFFWNNSIHDILYQYGFDEAAGNYQMDNLGRGGQGGDYIKAEGLDGSGTNNANFLITPDGIPGRMQMFLWSPQEIPPYGMIIPDGGYDNGIITHEYVHGVSTRLTGGPSSYTCLFSGEKMSEGWSDFFALMLTTDWSNADESDPRGIGTYVIGEDTVGTGIRAYPYSTDMNVNPMTYDDLKISFGSVHYIGTVWATMLWDMTWKLIELEGIDTDVYFGNGGNNIAMHLVMEGMKLQPCNPGFVDARDAILEADRLLYNGQYQCAIWEAFARRGLGVSAQQNISFFINDGVESFDIPAQISIREVGPDSSISENELIEVSYQMVCECQDQENVDVVIVPSKGFRCIPDTAYSLVNDSIWFHDIDILCGDTIMLNVNLEMDCLTSYDSTLLWQDSIESTDRVEAKLLEGSFGNWIKQYSIYNSSNTAWYAEDLSSTNVSVLELIEAVEITGRTYLSFQHQYETEYFWDGGFIQYQLEGDTSWNDAEDFIVKNGYPAGRGFTGSSADDIGPGFIESIIDFSPLIGSTIRVRFLFNCDVTVGGSGINGWYIDDLKLVKESGENTKSIIVTPTDTTERFHNYYSVLPGGQSWYVDTANIVMQDGLSWATAINDLQLTLQSAQCGDTIHLAQGVYFPTTDGKRDSTFYLVSGITIVGGYPTGGGTLADRDPADYESVLSGNIGHPDSISDNSYHIIRLDSLQRAVVLDGLSITNAFADGSGDFARGGAIFNQGELDLKNIHIYEITGNDSGYVIFNDGKDALLTIQNSRLNFEILTGREALLNREEAKMIILDNLDINK